jgi:hypothetical protein
MDFEKLSLSRDGVVSGVWRWVRWCWMAVEDGEMR